MDSPAIFWLALVPLEAALSASRRSAVTAASYAAIAFALPMWMSLASALPPAHLPGLDLLSRLVVCQAIKKDRPKPIFGKRSRISHRPSPAFPRLHPPEGRTR